MQNIKSYYILKLIFCFSGLDEKRLLRLVKYNKGIQSTLKINLSNYILLSRKYIIFGTNKKGLEYLKDNDKLIFEENI